ncbi:MAG: ribokinase [Cyanobacteria bacterium P01_H01_bin.121]
MSLAVLGSINLDLVVQAQRLPIAGETLIGQQFQQVPGGKGANQAVAAARLGIATAMIGRVGGDSFGSILLDSLKMAGIATNAVAVDANTHSGIALITVAKDGANQIVLAPGANGAVGPAELDQLQQVIQTGQLRVLLLQCEVPLATVVAAAQLAKAAGVTVILDPAPAPAVFPTELYSCSSILTPNQVEAAQLTGQPVNTWEEAAQAAAILRDRGCETVIITLGGLGAYCCSASQTYQIPNFPVDAIDTTAAGDAFNGGLGAALAQGYSLDVALRWGMGSGALACTKSGAQPSLPDRDSLLKLLETA